MATLPRATTSVQATAGATAGGTDLVCVISPVPQNADAMPRQFGGAAAVHSFHGYSEGVEYVSHHAQETRKPVLFCGIPIVTEGAIGREDKSGNTGSSVSTVTAGAGGCLAEHDGAVRVAAGGGGTVGEDQIKLEYSLDGQRTWKPLRLGTSDSYTFPYVNALIDLGAGDLNAGDVIHTWHGTAPRGDADGWQAARENLAAQLKLFRTILLIGDLQSDTEAAAFLGECDAYETENERFTVGRASVRDRLPQAALSQTIVRMTGDPSLTFDTTADTITRSAGSWIADGFVIGDSVKIDGTDSNDTYAVVTAVTALVLTFTGTNLVNEGPISGVTVVGYPTLTFAEVDVTGDTITRNRGSWLADGFRVGDLVTVVGTGSNDLVAVAGVAAVTATVLTFGATDLQDETIGIAEDPNGSEGTVSITAGQTKAAWMADIDAEFESIDAAKRINLASGRARRRSPFSGWFARRSPAWAASIREYKHDIHVATWRKSDGPTGWDLNDANGNLVEWDDRVDGEAASAARFTSFRTWANGPRGAFVGLDLTRAGDGDILSNHAKMVVTNLACTIVQEATEDAAIGQDLTLNDDGTATGDSLETIASKVNSALELGLLQNARGEGPRASRAVWSADPDTLFNVPEPILVGTLDLTLNGTVHSVITTVRVRTGGQ